VLKHHNAIPKMPPRTVVLGAGFIGGTAVKHLRAVGGSDVVSLGSKDVDLLDEGAAGKLARLLKVGDTLVVVSARAPVKSHAMLIDNIRMMDVVTAALATVSVDHIIYISSDAVYADSEQPLTERSCAQPASLHGIMHLAREVMLANAYAGPLCFLRPTLVYGADDPHSGYGPNRFRRLAERGEEIVLFGEGEERRDHVLVDDVAEIICRVVQHKSTGVLNIATGDVASFRQIAEMTIDLFPSRVSIKTTPRSGPMPHNGYRPFDAAATRTTFPDFRYVGLTEGLRRAAAQMAGVHG
jgi:nucleoside-diphosphate-sugar epimerase